MNLAIIPAKGFSKRLPGKNIRPFHGKPVIAYSIAAAKESGLFDAVIVSSNDSDVNDVAHKYGAMTMKRSLHYAHPELGTQEVAVRCPARPVG
jgi:pseudaminic acid cytidylyltransferase